MTYRKLLEVLKTFDEKQLNNEAIVSTDVFPDHQFAIISYYFDMHGLEKDPVLEIDGDEIKDSL